MPRYGWINVNPQLTIELKAEAKRLGFSLVGIAPATEADGFAQFERWLDAGFHGEMDYLQNRREARRHPRSILDSVQSVVVLGMDYSKQAENQLPPNHGRVASYACGPDYHPYLWDLLKQLGAWLESQIPNSQTRGVTDSAPLLERDFARRAGLGWFGKNTMLINKHTGSYFFLAALLTNAALAPDDVHSASHCGTCTACLDACPTDAFPQAGVLDARKCISYFTIESKTIAPIEHRSNIGNWIFGCDICQEVCPWNRNAESRTVHFPSQPDLASISAIELLNLSREEFRLRFRLTSLSRAKWQGLRRNAAIVLGNIGDERAIPALEQAIRDDDLVVSEVADWAKHAILERHNDNRNSSDRSDG